MEAVNAELSSISTALEEMAARLAELGEQYLHAQKDEVATDLFQAEASLVGVARRLRRVRASRR